MAVNTTDVRNQVAKAAQQQNKPTAPRQDTVAQLIESMKGEMAKALPRHISADRLARVLLTTLRQQPELLECTKESLLGALMLCAQFGLEPGPLGHVYLIPRWNGKLKRKEVQFMLGYTGLLELMWRSGRLESLSIHEVYEKDKFEFQYGLEEKLIHVPTLADDRGKIIAYYLVAKYRDGAHFAFVMTPQDIERHRQHSSAKDTGPWVNSYIEMAWKTVLRTAARWMPKSIEVERALFADEGTVSLGEGSQLEVGHTYEGQAEPIVEPMPEPETPEAERATAQPETPPAAAPSDLFN